MPRSGLFVYVSNNVVKKFKFKINTELKFLSKSVFQIIMRLIKFDNKKMRELLWCWFL